jgi:Domain of unknown function (DUF4389)
MAAESDRHPVRLVVGDDLRRSRLTVFFRLLLAVPHLVWLGLFTIAAVVAGLLNWFATLFAGRSPQGLHNFLVGYVRYATHVFAYLFLAANPYPPFSAGAAAPTGVYPVDLEIDPPAPQSRWITGFRIVLVIPALLLAGALSGGGSAGNTRVGMSGGASSIAALLSWFSALVRGRSPRGLRDLLIWSVGYSAEVYAYLLLLTDRYPRSDPRPFLSGLEPPEAPGRARLVNQDDLRRSRLSVFFRLPLAVPHIFWLLLWSVAAFFVALANWFVALVRGEPAQSLARFLAAYVRYTAHVTAFLYVVANPFPGFVGAAGSYPVDIGIEPPGRQHRLVTLFRLFLGLPALLVASGLGSVLLTAGVLVWFASLVLARAPAGLQMAGAYSIGYSAQVNCYLLLLTDRYPHSSPLAVLPEA